MQWRRLLKMPLLPCNTKDADYTKVDAAIAKANALNKDNYKDFSAVETAVNAVVRDQGISLNRASPAWEAAVMQWRRQTEKY